MGASSTETRQGPNSVLGHLRVCLFLNDFHVLRRGIPIMDALRKDTLQSKAAPSQEKPPPGSLHSSKFTALWKTSRLQLSSLLLSARSSPT